MITEQRSIEVRGIPVEIVRKNIKNLHLGVYPPKGKVRVAAPFRLDDEAVRLAVVCRLGWIRRQQRTFQAQDRQSRREMVTGESHYFQGRRYRLNVVEKDGLPFVRLPNSTTMELTVPPGTNRDGRETVLRRWYRRRLRNQVATLLPKWQPKIDVQVAEVRIKRMKTRWGTCNNEACRVWLNLELIKKPVACLEYIFVHEMVHLVERHHNDRFKAIMDHLMPQWPLRREELNLAPLAHDDWDY